MLKMQTPQEQLVEIMKRIYAQGMTTTSGGNLSIKDTDGNIYITPGGTDKGSMTVEDIVCIHPDGRIEGKHKPSSEYPFHMKIYEVRDDIKAILHAHPPAMVAYSIVRKIPDITVFPGMEQCIGSVGMAEYGLTGSEELGDKIGKVFAGGKDVAELENHGLVVGSGDILTAYHKFEAMDFCARIGIGASRLKGFIADKEKKTAFVLKNDVLETKEKEKPEHQALCKKLCDMVQRAYHQKLFYAGLGNISVRAEDGTVYYIPEGTDQKNVSLQDVRCMDVKGEGIHAAIYRMHPEINAVITAFPPELMAFAVTGTKFSSRIIPEIYMVMQDVISVPYSAWNGEPEKLAEQFDERTSVAILEQQGIIVTAPSLLKAYDRLEVAEYSASAIIKAQQLGGIIEITETQVEDIKRQCHLY